MATPKFPVTWKLLKTVFAYACGLAFLAGILVTAGHLIHLYPVVLYVGLAWLALIAGGCYLAFRDEKRKHKPLIKGTRV